MPSDELLKEVAELIILSHAKDIEYISIREMSYDDLDMQDMSYEEQDDTWNKLYKLIQKAEVTVTFK